MYGVKYIDLVSLALFSGKCTAITMVDVVKAAGGNALVIVTMDGALPTLPKNAVRLPAMLISVKDGATVVRMIRDAAAVNNGPPVSLRSNPVLLQASVGHLNRGIVVQGVVEQACTNRQYSDNVRAIASHCKGVDHWECKELGHVPHDCYHVKGFGLQIKTSDLLYSNGDAKIGTITAKGVEFVNLGKLDDYRQGQSISNSTP